MSTASPSVEPPPRPEPLDEALVEGLPTDAPSPRNLLLRRHTSWKAARRLASRASYSWTFLLVRAFRKIQSGAFINHMWGEAGTVLGAVQMFLIRLFMIWPIKAITPAAFAYWAFLLLRRLRGHKQAYVKPVTGVWPAVRETMRWGGYEGLRVWSGIECLFYLYYRYKHWMLENKKASAPLLPPGETKKALRKALDTVKMIQVGGKLTDPHLKGTTSYAMLSSLTRGRKSPQITPKTSAADLQGMLHHRGEEASVEELLREWHDERLAIGSLDTQVIAMTDEERSHLEQLVDDAEVLALKQAEASGWFLKKPRCEERWPARRIHEIRRDNIEEWVAWAFWQREAHAVPPSRRQELQELVDLIIDWADMGTPEPGRNPEVAAMRLTMDPIPSVHRPLLYYAVTQYFMSQATRIQFRSLGFRTYWSGTLLYWYRPPTPKGAKPVPDAHPENPPPPIVFCHGIGVNILPYQPFIKEMLAQFPDRGFYLISMENISMRIKEDVPSAAEMVACISDMLASWNCTSAHFVGHSFGSLPLAWMARRAPNLVAAMTFVDPVCFLLIKPDVCYNFMYRRPTDPTQLLINYFLAKELYIAHSLSRNFFWYQNQLWPEDLPAPTLVALSAHDSIVPAHSVRRYLTAYKNKCNMKTLRILWFPDLGHGEINFGPVGEAACARIASEMVRLEEEHQVLANAKARSQPRSP